MQNPKFEALINAWQQRTQQDSPLKITKTCIQSIRLLANGQPVSTEKLAEVSQLSLADTRAALARLNQCGCELDTQGNLVGAVLTLNPTRHQFQVNGHHLFAWCAMDTLFLPALLGQAAQVESTCPATGTKIRLTIAPDGIETVDPPETVVSVIIPGITPSCEIGAKSGPQGPVCSAMHFFKSTEAASTWLVAHPGTTILDVDKAWQLAQAVWIKPYQEYIEISQPNTLS